MNIDSMNWSILERVSERGHRAMIANIDLLRDAKKNVGRVRTIILEFQKSANNETFLVLYTDPNDIQIAKSVLRSGCVRVSA